MKLLTRCLVSLSLCTLVVSSASCADKEVELLFDEQGTWELIRQDVTASTGLVPVDNARQGKFWLQFTRSSETEELVSGQVVAASCLDQQGESSAAGSSPCSEEFRCDCYNYQYAGEMMTWTFLGSTHAQPGSFDTDGETDGPMDLTEIGLGTFEDFSNAFRFRPLPNGLMGCEGSSCQAVFQGGRAATAFEQTGCHENAQC